MARYSHAQMIDRSTEFYYRVSSENQKWFIIYFGNGYKLKEKISINEFNF